MVSATSISLIREEAEAVSQTSFYISLGMAMLLGYLYLFHSLHWRVGRGERGWEMVLSISTQNLSV